MATSSEDAAKRNAFAAPLVGCSRDKCQDIQAGLASKGGRLTFEPRLDGWAEAASSSLLRSSLELSETKVYEL